MSKIITSLWLFLKGKKRYITIAYGNVAAAAMLFFGFEPTSKQGITLFVIGIVLSFICGAHGVFSLTGTTDRAPEEQ